MQFDAMIIEVDGTLDNPRVVIAAFLWSLILSAAVVKLVSQYRQGQRGAPKQMAGRRVGLLVRVTFLFVVTPVAQSSLGHLLYQVEGVFSSGPGITSVGFWGGPPVLPAWIVALVCMWAALRRDARLGQAADGGTA